MTLPPDSRPRSGFGSLPSKGWEATRVETQIATRFMPGGPDADVRDIGRPVDDRTRELFVVVDPAEALIQQFDQLRPEYVAVHDLGTNASRKLIGGLAAASQRPVQRLVFRRAGGGMTLATIEFIDCVAANQRTVRLYSTAVEADTAARHAMARVLLARSAVGVVIVGDLPPHALATAFEPWREAALRAEWPCPRMLFLPLGPGTALFDEVGRFRHQTRVEATTMPPVTRPAEVWAHLCGAWNTMQKQRNAGQDPATLPLLGTGLAATAAAVPAAAGGAAAAVAPVASMAPVAPVAPAAAAPVIQAPPVPAPPPAARPPTPMPVVGQPAPTADEPLEHYLHQLSHLSGVLSACVFDLASGRPVSHAGARPGPEDLGRYGSAILASIMTGSRAMGLGAAVPDATITLGQHHLVVRAVPGHPGMALHLVLDKPIATLALVMLQLRRLDEALLAATKPAGPATTG
ncbi:MAG TPA: hypothetical protein VLI72_10345 [Methylibium sp.]|nr:hypothetical protein [Methylibium sp.]